MKYIIFLLLSMSAHAENVTGRVVHVSDGDTLTLDSRKVIRLAQIDAPEISHFGVPAQPYGKEAKDLLSFLALNKQVTVNVLNIDQYGRSVGEVLQNGISVNEQMVKSGAAWVYTRYNLNPLLPNVELAARNAHLGLWAAANPTPPWEYRKSAKKP